jgi:hypothetical protein
MAAQTLSHLDLETVRAMLNMALRSHRKPAPVPAPSDTMLFLRQSMFYALSQPHRLLASFRSKPATRPEKDLAAAPSLDIGQAEQSLRLLAGVEQDLLLHCLWLSAASLLKLPPEHACEHSQRIEPNPCLTEDAASMLTVICLHGLLAVTPIPSPESALALSKARELGYMAPDEQPLKERPLNEHGEASSIMKESLRFVDALDNDLARRLARRIVRGIAARLYHDEAEQANVTLNDDDSAIPSCLGKRRGFSDALKRLLKDSQTVHFSLEQDAPVSSLPKFAIVLEWIRDIVMQGWDGKAKIDRFGDVGSAVIVMSELCKSASFRYRSDTC